MCASFEYILNKGEIVYWNVDVKIPYLTFVLLAINFHHNIAHKVLVKTPRINRPNCSSVLEVTERVGNQWFQIQLYRIPKNSIMQASRKQNLAPDV